MNEPQQLPDPGFAITIKDIYEAATKFAFTQFASWQHEPTHAEQELFCAEFNETIRKFIDSTCETLQIRKVTPEEKEAAIKKANEFQDNIQPFGKK